MRTLLTDAERSDLLWQLFDALLKHLVKVLSSDGPIKASMLDVARHFLAMNQITATTRVGAQKGLETLQQQMERLPFDPTKKGD